MLERIGIVAVGIKDNLSIFSCSCTALKTLDYLTITLELTLAGPAAAISRLSSLVEALHRPWSALAQGANE